MKVLASKDPDEILRYVQDWSADLAAGETITDAEVVEVDAAGTTQPDPVTHDDTTATMTLADGIDGSEATYTMRVTTSAGEVFEELLVVPIAAKVAAEPHPGDYTPPTAANLVALYPEFATVPATTIESYLARAARSVDTSWTEGDFGYGRMALAAHLMTINGIGSTAEAASVVDGSGQFRSMGIGSLRLERFDPARSSSVSANFASTRYGREFARLLRVNRGGPRVAGYSSVSDAGASGDNFGPWTGPWMGP
jgi:hypothetical protein